MKKKLLEKISLLKQHKIFIRITALPRRSQIAIGSLIILLLASSSILAYKIYQTKDAAPANLEPNSSQSPLPTVFPSNTPKPSPSPLSSFRPLTPTSSQSSPSPSPTPTSTSTSTPTPTPTPIPTSTPTPTPTSTPQNSCTPVTFSKSLEGNTVIIKIEGAWWLSVKEDPAYDNVTFDTNSLIIFLHYNSANSGTVYIYEKSYEGAPLCQTYNWSR